MPRRCDIPPEHWDRAADLYELGFKNGRQLAEALGVSPQTVMREMKCRGAVKGRRAFESVAELEAFLDRKARRRAHMKMMAETSAAERRAARMAVINRMMEAIVAADEHGDLALAEADISIAASAFRVQLPRRRRSR